MRKTLRIGFTLRLAKAEIGQDDDRCGDSWTTSWMFSWTTIGTIILIDFACATESCAILFPTTTSHATEWQTESTRIASFWHRLEQTDRRPDEDRLDGGQLDRLDIDEIFYGWYLRRFKLDGTILSSTQEDHRESDDERPVMRCVHDCCFSSEKDSTYILID